jgi:Fe-S cluster biosynthesis and repair protein YggX
MDIAQRIAQFENMTKADPDNEMAHFSLGGAYAQAGRHADAAASYLRCLDLAPGMSKAYQLAGESLVKAGDRDKAAQVLTRGYVVATEAGDFLPKKSIAALLEQIGRPVPEVTGNAAGSGAGAPAAAPVAGGFVCKRTGKPGTKLDRPPFKGKVGEWIGANISKETWTAWIGQGTKVINELRLDLSKEQDAITYDKAMYDYLGIDDELLAALGVKA